MNKIVKQWGNNLIISFTKDDQRVCKLSEGDIIDLSDMVVIKKEHEEADMNISNLLTKQRRDENEYNKTRISR